MVAPPGYSIPTRGITWVDSRIALASLIVGPLMALCIVGLTAGGPTQNTPVKILVFVGCFSAYLLFITNAASVRRVDLDQQGVTFRYIVTKERASWADLRPGRSPANHGIWTIVRITKSGRRRGHVVTTEQALAILRHPNRPEWDLAPAVAESLGVGAQRPGPT